MKKFYFLLLATITIVFSAQAQTLIKGNVTDTKKDPVIGASVFIKDSSVGTITDVNGDFQFEVPAGTINPVLIVSLIGYTTEEFPLGTQTSFNIILTDDLKVLSEVVVVGYSSQQKEKITGSVVTVKSEDLIRLPVPTLDQALQGRAPGVVVSQNTGAPGEGVSIRIRGVGSINSGNNPLYVVDGVPTLDIGQIATQDIENITVLKDASASAIYGSRAANGVVIVTTKSGGSKGMAAPKIEINSQYGVQEPSRKLKMASTEQYVQIYNEAANTDNATKTASIFMRKLISDGLAATLPNIDQVDAIMRDGAIQSHSLSVSGGDEKTRYFISGNYFDQQGIVKASDFNRLSARVNVDSQIKKWLRSGVNLNLSKATTDLIGSSGDGAGGNGGSVLRYALFRTPAIDIYDANGNFIDKPDRFDLFGDGYNPVGMLAYNQNKRLVNRLFGKFYVAIEPIEGLKFTSNLGIDFEGQNQRRFDRTWGTDNRINGINNLNVNTARNQTITLSNTLTYNKSFGDHNFTFLVGNETIKGDYYALSSSQKNFPDQDASLTFLGNGTGLTLNSEGKSGNSLAAFFGKVDYDFNDKYLVSATVRRDGSSRFGPDNRWGTFYAGSLGWRIDKEFFEDNATIDRWLFRVGYGSIGNQEIGNYAYENIIGLNSYYPYGNVRTLGSSIANYGNNKIKWETSKQFNAGTDLELWNGKLGVSLDYFRKETSDMLMRQPLAASVGQNAFVWTNNGTMLNSGFELQVTHANSLGDFKYNVSANAATLHNEVVRLNTAPIPAGAVGSTYLTLTEAGYPVGSFFIYEAEGIFQNTTQIFTHAYQGDNIQPGDVMYKDQDSNGVIDGKDRKHIGSPIPKVTAGLNISLGYKNWDMSLFFQGAYGQKVFSVINRDLEGFYRPFNVTERYFENHWTGPGTSNEFPRASWDASSNNNLFSSRFLEDASYTRLKNVQLGYRIPSETLKKYGFTNVRIYFSGTNLLTFTKFQGLDPEMTVSDNAKGTGDLASGIDWGTYPAARSYNLGVNITF